MTTFPKLPGNSGIESDPTFCEGVAAFQQADYIDALAYFSAVYEANPHSLAGIHAQMGMILSYERYGQPEKAWEHCQAIRDYPEPMVRQWAEQAIASLEHRYPELAAQAQSHPSPKQLPTSQDQPSTAIESTDPTNLSPHLLDNPDAPNPPWQWRNAGRLASGRSLGKTKPWPLYWLQVATLVAFIALTYRVVDWLKATIAQVLEPLPYVYLIPLRYANSFLPVVGCLAGLWLVSPWLLDQLLIRLHGMEIQPATVVGKRHPEVLKVLNQLSQRQRIALPKLGILPIAAPVAISYGHRPRFTRIVLSRGLLDQLTSDELATVCAGEVAHILQGDIALMTLMTTVLQIPYLAYWGLATGADWFWDNALRTQRQVTHHWQANQRQPLWQRLVLISCRPITILHGVVLIGFYSLGLLSGLAYVIHWLLRLPALWFARQRLHASDRCAVELTGNPNGLVRALLKIAIGTAKAIQQQGYTPHLLESLDLLLPVGHRVSLTVGTAVQYTSPESVLAWDLINPYRGWLNLGHAQPLLGDRLHRLTTYALTWKLEPEITLPAPQPLQWPWLTELIRSPVQTIAQSGLYGYQLLLQSAPYIGLPLGLLLGWLTWGLLWLLDLLGLRSVGWMVGHPAILQAIVLTSFSVSVLVWVNPFFPEITPTNLWGVTTGIVDPTAVVQTPHVLVSLATQPTVLPSESQPVQITGTLLGRKGTANLFAQDLILQTQYGLVRLHHLFSFGPVLELWLQPTRPSLAIGQPVRVTGWLRRGATIWLDLDRLRWPDGTVSSSSHAVWMVIVATVTALYAGYVVIFNTR
ncbi:MAG: M48 family metalloprotease [Cyanobacteria bacterium]|nr:M48 family metalloprotease [Cyanobacteriota bacterium]MDW8202633.1 M48 family metalloprotease [Cyanobacteriota bacterium SKYGB_h_bin112]